MENEERSKLAQNELTTKISETIDFFQKSTKWIVIGIVLGMSISLIYMQYAQPIYKAKSSINLSVIKDPINFSELDQKLRTPSSYRISENEVCLAIKDFKKFDKNLIITHDLANPQEVDFGYLSTQPQEANACLERVILVADEFFKEKINSILKANEKDIVSLQAKIDAIKSAIREDSDSQIMAVANYLIKRDELNLYRSEIFKLKRDVNRAKESALLGVEYSTIQVDLHGPKRKVVFLNGIFSGLIFGLLVQLFLDAKLYRKKF